MNNLTRCAEFYMTNPVKLGNDIWRWHITIDKEYYGFIRNFNGINYTDDLNTVLAVEVDPRYDYQEVWLSLFYTLQKELEDNRLWGNALPE